MENSIFVAPTQFEFDDLKNFFINFFDFDES